MRLVADGYEDLASRRRRLIAGDPSPRGDCLAFVSRSRPELQS